MIMDEPMTESCWDAIGGILVINMDTSPERFASFLHNNAAGFPVHKVQRLSAVAGRQLPDYGKAPWFTAATGERAPFWGGTAGCALSHRRAVEYARNQGWRNVLILEDDAAYDAVAGAESLLNRALQTLQGDYMLYLGFNRPTPYGRRIMTEQEAGLWQIEGVLATHAYLLPASMYDRLLSLLPTEHTVWDWLSRYRAIDVFYRDFVAALPGVRIYAVLPVMFCQSDEQSDISGGAADGRAYACREEPHAYASLSGILHLLAYPWHRLKVRLNSVRTRIRAARGGLPGFKSRRS